MSEFCEEFQSKKNTILIFVINFIIKSFFYEIIGYPSNFGHHLKCYSGTFKIKIHKKCNKSVMLY